jgi:hypothetical protein
LEFGLLRERNSLYISPGVYLERIFPLVLDSINAIMDATPVETLPGVDPQRLMTAAPSGGFFDQLYRDRIRLLGGLT